jgi:hypothetical protein
MQRQEPQQNLKERCAEQVSALPGGDSEKVSWASALRTTVHRYS